jgi:hypothetical protein
MHVVPFWPGPWPCHMLHKHTYAAVLITYVDPVPQDWDRNSLQLHDMHIIASADQTCAPRHFLNYNSSYDHATIGDSHPPSPATTTSIVVPALLASVHCHGCRDEIVCIGGRFRCFSFWNPIASHSERHAYHAVLHQNLKLTRMVATFWSLIEVMNCL